MQNHYTNAVGNSCTQTCTEHVNPWQKRILETNMCYSNIYLHIKIGDKQLRPGTEGRSQICPETPL